MKKQHILVVLTVIIIVIISFFYLHEIKKTTPPRNEHFDYFVEYHLSVNNTANFTILAPFLDIYRLSNTTLHRLSNTTLLSYIIVTGNASCSVVNISTSDAPYSNISTLLGYSGFENNDRALEISGNGSVDINLKIIGDYRGILTLMNGDNTGEFWFYYEGEQSSISIMLTCEIESQHSMYVWNESKNTTQLNEGWNKVQIENYGLIEGTD